MRLIVHRKLLAMPPEKRAEQAKFGIGADKGSGSLLNNSAGAPGKNPLVLADKPFGEWNKVRILMVGARGSKRSGSRPPW